MTFFFDRKPLNNILRQITAYPRDGNEATHKVYNVTHKGKCNAFIYAMVYYNVKRRSAA